MSEGWKLLFKARMDDWKYEEDRNDRKIKKYQRKLEKYQNLKKRCSENYEKMKKKLEEYK